MRFEWDPKKDESNRKKHGIAFEMAQLVFGDPLACLFRMRSIRRKKNGG